MSDKADLLPDSASNQMGESSVDVEAAHVKEVLSRHFDESFYLTHYKDVKSDALDHYIDIGWKELKDPSPDFSTRFYLDKNADVKESSINPYFHYLAFGKDENRVSRVSLLAIPDFPDCTIDLLKLCEYKRVIAPYFNEAYYLKNNKDIRESETELNPLEHYILNGWREGRDPSPYFSTSYYLNTYEDLRQSGGNPYYHYLVFGKSEGRFGQPPGGIKAKVLKNLTSFDEYISSWEKPPLPEYDSYEKLIKNFDKKIGSSVKNLVIAVSHDDYTTSTGGIQLGMLLEESRIHEISGCYVQFYPFQPLPVLGDDAKDLFLLHCNIDGTYCGCFSEKDILKYFQSYTNKTKIDSHLIIHSLLGHKIDFITKLNSIFNFNKSLFWIHDYFSICTNFTLLRNSIEFCSAPALGCNACSLCYYGEKREKHIQQFTKLFDALSFDIIAPSEVAAKIWVDTADYKFKNLTIIPHCTPTPIDDKIISKKQLSAGAINVGFLGYASFHKGFSAFENLSNLLTANPSFKFHHLAKLNSNSMADINFLPVSVSKKDPEAMKNAIKNNSIDIAVIWSVWPETFCFTAYEAFASGAFIITNINSGNVKVLVEKYNCGIVLKDDNELFNFFESNAVVEVLDKWQSRKQYFDLNYSDFSFTLLNSSDAKN